MITTETLLNAGFAQSSKSGVSVYSRDGFDFTQTEGLWCPCKFIAQYTPCQACGAVGEVGRTCQFCSTTIIVKEDSNVSKMRIVPERSISPQKYAEKISFYHKVEATKSPKLMKVSIGDEVGLINLNGELVYPLQHKYHIFIVSDNIIHLLGTQDKLILQSGKTILLGTLLDLETMKTYAKVEHGIGDLSFFAWENKKCKGSLDPLNWEIVGSPSFERATVAMTQNEYIEKKKQEERQRQQREEKELQRQQRERREKSKERKKQKEEGQTDVRVLISKIRKIMFGA